MTDSSLQRLTEFNEQLSALSAADVPLDLGIQGSHDEIMAQLDQYQSVIANQCQDGKSVEQVLTESSDLNPTYRSAAWAWLHCRDSSIVLDGISTPADTRSQFGRNVGRTLVYPLIILSLAYLGFLYLCNFVGPKIDAIYGQLEESPGTSLSFLLRARETMPIWALLLPLLVVVGLIWWKSSSSQFTWNWIPGNSRYFSSVRDANIARQLATLLESGCSLEDSLKLVDQLPIWQLPGRNAKDGSGQPPAGALLRWAVTDDVGDEPLPRVLRFVEHTYRQSAQRQQTIWELVAPTICGVLLGGAFVLGYGLSLFLPVIQMLKDVSMPGGV